MKPFHLIIIFSFIFIFIFISYVVTTTPSSQTKNEIIQKAIELKTTKNIHNYLWFNNNYSYGTFPKNINNYWENRIGDCTEVATIKKIMYDAIDVKSRRTIFWVNGIKHDDVKILSDIK